MKLELAIRPRKILMILGFTSCLLAGLSIISEYIVEIVMGGTSNSLLALILDLFSVNLEQSIPTWFSTLILFFSGLLLAIIAIAKTRTQTRYFLHWIALALLFFYFSMDEAAAIHEILANLTQTSFHPEGFFYFGWQIVAIPLVILFALAYLRFLFHLPAHIRNLFIVAGLLFVGGALFMDGIGANQWYLDDGISLAYLVMGTVEELLEMLGVTVFIYALLSYIIESDITLSFVYGAVVNNQVVINTEKPTTKPSDNFFSKLNPSLLIIVFLVSISLFMFSRILQDQQLTNAPQSFYASISEELNRNDILVLEMNHGFAVDDINALQMADSLLSQFDELLIVSFPSANHSTIFAGDSLPFDDSVLTELLHAHGDVEFIIFDSPLLRTLISQLQPTASK